MAGETYTSKTSKGAARNATKTEDVMVSNKHASFLDKKLAPKDNPLERTTEQSSDDAPISTRDADKARSKAGAGERVAKQAVCMVFVNPNGEDLEGMGSGETHPLEMILSARP